MADKLEIANDVKNLLEYARTLGMTEVRRKGKGGSEAAQGASPAPLPGEAPPAGKRAAPLPPEKKAAALEELRLNEIGD